MTQQRQREYEEMEMISAKEEAKRSTTSEVISCFSQTSYLEGDRPEGPIVGSTYGNPTKEPKTSRVRKTERSTRRK